MTWQPAPSIPLASQPSSWRRPSSCQSIPVCWSSHLFFCLPLLLPPCTVPWRIVLASPVDLVTYPTISVCVSLLRSRGLRGAQWLAEFCFAPLRWRCGLCRRCRGAFWGISSPWPVSFSLCLLLVSKTHRRIGMWTWPGSASVWYLSWALYSCHSRCSWVLRVLLRSGRSWREFQVRILHLRWFLAGIWTCWSNLISRRWPWCQCWCQWCCWSSVWSSLHWSACRRL